MEDRKDKQDAQRILLIKEAVNSAEKNLQAAKSLLAQLESKWTPQKKTYGVAEGGKIVEGSFDGQLMIGTDGRQYPVPANYASKSKLVEGDMLKLVITDDGNFIYKQIGPFKRKRVIGLLRENKEEGGYVVGAEGKVYKVLLAAVTYHHANPGDEVALVVADTEEAKWGAIENVTKKGAIDVDGQENNQKTKTTFTTEQSIEREENLEPEETGPTSLLDEEGSKKPKKAKGKDKKKEDQLDAAEKTESEAGKLVEEKDSAGDQSELDEELTPDLKEIEKELKKQVTQKE